MQESNLFLQTSTKRPKPPKVPKEPKPDRESTKDQE